MRDEAALFAAQAAEAFVLKTASSIDDVLWFAKFLTRERSRVERGRNIFVYCVICLLQTMLAFLIARSGEEALDAWVHLHHFSSERLLTCIAAGGLGLYSIKLLLEEFEEREMCCYAPKEGYEQTPTSEKKPFPSKKSIDDEDDVNGVEMLEVRSEGSDDSPPRAARAEGSDEKPTASPLHETLEDVDLEANDSGDDDEDDDDEEEMDTSSMRTLVVVAFCGSLDDLTLFVPMLAGGAIGPLALVTGALAATGLVVLLCLFLNLFSRVSDCLQKIPLVAITSCFFVYLVLKATVLSGEMR
jgi:hypothetical protein